LREYYYTNIPVSKPFNEAVWDMRWLINKRLVGNIRDDIAKGILQLKEAEDAGIFKESLTRSSPYSEACQEALHLLQMAQDMDNDYFTDCDRQTEIRVQYTQNFISNNWEYDINIENTEIYRHRKGCGDVLKVKDYAFYVDFEVIDRVIEEAKKHNGETQTGYNRDPYFKRNTTIL
jgi:hypothetical protein